jgi:hypothetical protein
MCGGGVRIVMFSWLLWSGRSGEWTLSPHSVGHCGFSLAVQTTMVLTAAHLVRVTELLVSCLHVALLPRPDPLPDSHLCHSCMVVRIPRKCTPI